MVRTAIRTVTKITESRAVFDKTASVATRIVDKNPVGLKWATACSFRLGVRKTGGSGV